MKVTVVNQKHTTHARRADLYRGIYARVARQLRVSRQMVSQVAGGRKKSKRVSQALTREFRRIERLSQAA